MNKFIRVIKSRGYSFDYSKSNNALGAESQGIYPLSTASGIVAKNLGITKQQAKWLLEKIGSSEWHHTSSWYNATDYYDTNTESILDYFNMNNIEDLKKYIKDNFTKPTKQEPQGYYGDIDYLVWSGTRKHPHADEYSLKDVYIVEKGSFYYVYKSKEDYEKGNLLLKKKIGSNGTYVNYKRQ